MTVPKEALDVNMKCDPEVLVDRWVVISFTWDRDRGSVALASHLPGDPQPLDLHDGLARTSRKTAEMTAEILRNRLREQRSRRGLTAGVEVVQMDMWAGLRWPDGSRVERA